MLVKKDGNVIFINFNKNKINRIREDIVKIDPKNVLDEEALVYFYETVDALGGEDNVSVMEWNHLIHYTKKVVAMIDHMINMNEQYNERKRRRKANTMTVDQANENVIKLLG